MTSPHSDLALFDAVLRRLAPRKGTSGYRELAEALDVDPDTPRVWKRRLRLGQPLARHVRARLVLLADQRTQRQSRHLNERALAPAVQRLARKLVAIHRRLDGRGRYWRLIEQAISLADGASRDTSRKGRSRPKRPQGR